MWARSEVTLIVDEVVIGVAAVRAPLELTKDTSVDSLPLTHEVLSNQLYGVRDRRASITINDQPPLSRASKTLFYQHQLMP